MAANDYRERRRLARQAQTTSLNEIAWEIPAGKRGLSNTPADMTTAQTRLLEAYVSQCSQGPIADHSRERLARETVRKLQPYVPWHQDMLACIIATRS